MKKNFCCSRKLLKPTNKCDENERKKEQHVRKNAIDRRKHFIYKTHTKLQVNVS